MTMHVACGGSHGASPRQVAAAAGGGGSGAPQTGTRAQMASAATGGRRAGHRHPRPLFSARLFRRHECRRRALQRRVQDGRADVLLQDAGRHRTAGCRMKFIDTKQRLAEMDAAGRGRAGALAHHAHGLLGGRRDQPQARHAPGTTAPIAAHKANPDRFVVLATLPMLDRDRAIDELNRVAQLPGVRGVYMGTNINGNDLDDPHVRADPGAHRGARSADLPASAADHRRQARGRTIISAT